MTLRHAALAATFLATVAVSPAQATYLTNGGFETGDFTGWTQSGNNFFTFVDGIFGGASPTEGSKQAILGPRGFFGSIEQSFAAAPGAPLVLSFDLFNAGGLNPGGTPSFVDVIFNGVALLSFFELAAQPYTSYSLNLTGLASGTNDLRFTFRHEIEYWALDNVAVNNAAVPEPAALALFGLALAGLGVARRARG